MVTGVGATSSAAATSSGTAGLLRPRSPLASPAPSLSLPSAWQASDREVVSTAVAAEAITLSQERRELLCSVIGLSVKLGLVVVAGVSLMRLAGAFQQRMERQHEIAAVLELQTAKLARARDRFDALFMLSGEQRLIREQSQWIAPNRMRIVWQEQPAPSAVQTASLQRSADSTRVVQPNRPRP